MARSPLARFGPYLLSSLLGVLAAGGFMEPVQAQRATGTVGLGAQAGRPSGLAAKLYRHAQLSYDLMLAWDLNHTVFGHAHRVHEGPLPNSPLHVFAGPGLFGRFDGTRPRHSTTFGISGAFGLNFFRGRFEVFLQTTPRLRLYPNTRGRLGGGVGLRYFF